MSKLRLKRVANWQIPETALDGGVTCEPCTILDSGRGLALQPAVCPDGTFMQGVWIIVHTPSGLTVSKPMRQGIARSKLERLLPVADWTLPASALKAKEIGEEVCAVLNTP